MNGVRRTYAIERDEHGLPVRMIWTGDYRKVPIVYETCPKCAGSPPLHDGRCFHCWGDFRGEYREVRVWREINLDTLLSVPPSDATDPTSSPTPPKEAQEAEERVYHAYVSARELREKRPADCIEIDKIIDGLKAARRFIFRSYALSVPPSSAQQGEETEDSAGLIGQPIPDVAETEPRLNK